MRHGILVRLTNKESYLMDFFKMFQTRNQILLVELDKVFPRWNYYVTIKRELARVNKWLDSREPGLYCFKEIMVKPKGSRRRLVAVQKHPELILRTWNSCSVQLLYPKKDEDNEK